MAIMWCAAMDRARCQVQTRFLYSDENINKYMEYLWCPSKLLGTMCPENSLTYYYKCCGDLNNQCCYHTRKWVLVVGMVTPLFVLVTIVAFIIKKFCFAPRQRYMPGRQQ
ncbi:hypothetical protein Tcan_09894 [Toxocara canis]|uniref:Uncharacterized protein n=1 Tax=Toxocara canis TaxID=6265 RepID=A0A0B2VGP8_TOXCA|nr:hypothetical protein Tcan_09894 [Toxocara canis]